MQSAVVIGSETRSRVWLGAIWAALLVAVVWAAAAHEPAIAGLAVVAAASIALSIRRPEILLGIWIASTPYASYVLRFPEERSILTFDRIVLAVVVVSLLSRATARRGRLPGLTLFEISWLAFCVVAFASALAVSTEKGLAFRTTADAFVLPLILFYALRVGLDARAGARPIFWGAVILGLSLPWIGLAEFVTARDVMAFKGASIFRTGIVRANGPFQTDNSYSIISALVGVFVAWLPRALGLKLDPSARRVSSLAQFTAYLAALVPIFRAIMGAIAGALALPFVLAGRIRTLARAGLVGLLLAIAAIPVIVPLSRTATFQDRITDPSSAFSRLATYFAAADVIEDHPITGVGLTNYHEYFQQKFGTAWYIDVEAVADVGAEAYPHNNLLGVWAELGIFGVFFYAVAAVALAGLAWRRRSVGALALMVVYWVPGMFLESGVYSDLNLYYFAMLGVLLADSSCSRHIARV